MHCPRHRAEEHPGRGRWRVRAEMRAEDGRFTRERWAYLVASSPRPRHAAREAGEDMSVVEADERSADSGPRAVEPRGGAERERTVQVTLASRVHGQPRRLLGRRADEGERPGLDGGPHVLDPARDARRDAAAHEDRVSARRGQGAKRRQHRRCGDLRRRDVRGLRPTNRFDERDVRRRCCHAACPVARAP